MKTYIWVLVLASLMVVGCGKAKSSQQAANINADSLSVAQADTLLAQPGEETKQQANALVANVVVNAGVGPLVTPAQETTASVPSDAPDPASVQTALKNLGLYSGEVDGKIGPKTKEAIKTFQRKNNLGADGKVGPKTWAILKNSLPVSQATTQKK